jgi:hypothetical protein
MLNDDSSVLSEIYSQDQRARVLDEMSPSPVVLEKRSLWKKKKVGAGNTTVLIEFDEYQANFARKKKRIEKLMMLLVLNFL